MRRYGREIGYLILNGVVGVSLTSFLVLAGNV